MKDKITFAQFLELEKQLEIKVGKIIDVEDVPKSTKLLKMTVDFDNGDVRTVVTNIKEQLTHINYLKGHSVPFITNLEPTKIMGIVSEAMICPMKYDEKGGGDYRMIWPELIFGTIIF